MYLLSSLCSISSDGELANNLVELETQWIVARRTGNFVQMAVIDEFAHIILGEVCERSRTIDGIDMGRKFTNAIHDGRLNA